MDQSFSKLEILISDLKKQLEDQKKIFAKSTENLQNQLNSLEMQLADVLVKKEPTPKPQINLPESVVQKEPEKTPEKVVLPPPLPPLPPLPSLKPVPAKPIPQFTPPPILPERKKRDWSQWEAVIGTNWLSRIGIIIVALGLVFFMKYSFDNNLISPSVRILMAMVLGLLSLAGGEYFLRKKMPSQAQVFWGGGILILYASIVIAKNYPFIGGVVIASAPLALGLMVLVTVVANVLATFHKSMVVAVLGFIGGFITPLVVGKPSGLAYPLLLYLGILTLFSLYLYVKEGWKPLIFATLFLSFLEPLVLKFYGPTQNTHLFIYLFVIFCGTLFLSRKAITEKILFTLLFLIVIAPLIGLARTVGLLASPIVIYSYFLGVSSLFIFISSKKEWGDLQKLSLCLLFTPVIFFRGSENYLSTHSFSIYLLSFIYSLLALGLGLFHVKKLKTKLTASWFYSIAFLIPVFFFPDFNNAISWANQDFLSKVHSFNSFVPIWGWVSLAYIGFLLSTAFFFNRKNLIFWVPLSLFVFKIILPFPLLVTGWPVIFGFVTFVFLLGAMASFHENKPWLLLVTVVTSFFYPVMSYLTLPPEIWIRVFFVFLLFQVFVSFVVCYFRSWKTTPLAFIALFFISALWAQNLIFSQNLDFHFYFIALALGSVGLAKKVSNQWIGVAGFLSAFLFPVFYFVTQMPGSFSYFAGWYPYDFIIVTGGLALIFAFVFNWQKVGLTGVIFLVILSLLLIGSMKTKNFDPLFYLRYLVVLNAIVLVLSFIRRWALTKYVLLWLTLGFSSLFLSTDPELGNIPVSEKMFLVSLIFLLHFSSLVADILSSRFWKTSREWQYILVLPIYYFAWMYHFLMLEAPSFLGVLAISISVFYMGLGFLFWKKKGFKISKGEVLPADFFVLSGVAVFFITLAIPLQLNAKLITVVWAFEAALLYWAGFQLRQLKIRTAGLFVLFAAFTRFFFKDLIFVTPTGLDSYLALGFHYTCYVSTRFIAGVVLSFVVLFMASFIKKLEGESSKQKKSIALSALFFIGANIFFLWILSSEVGGYLLANKASVATAKYRGIVYSMIWGVHATILLVFGLIKKNLASRLLALALFGIVLVKIFAYDIWAFNQAIRILGFVFLGILLLLAGFLYTKFKKRLFE